MNTNRDCNFIKLHKDINDSFIDIKYKNSEEHDISNNICILLKRFLSLFYIKYQPLPELYSCNRFKKSFVWFYKTRKISLDFDVKYKTIYIYYHNLDNPENINIDCIRLHYQKIYGIELQYIILEMYHILSYLLKKHMKGLNI